MGPVRQASAALAMGQASEKPSYRYYVLLIIAIGQSFSFLDRQIVTILLPPIKAELGVTDSQLGLMSGIAFALFYAGFGVPLARLADRWSRRNIMAISVIVWSAITTLAGFAQTFPQLVLSRFGVGIGEAGYSPAAFSLLSDYFNRAQRQTALAVVNIGPHVGAMLGLVIGGMAAPVIGWRGAFFIAGIPGLFFGLVVLFTVREPGRGQSDGVAIAAGPHPSFLRSLQMLWHIPSYRWLVLGGALFAFASIAQSAWMPSFFARSHDMQLRVIGPALGLTLIVCAPVGTLLGGVLGDRLGRRDARRSLLLPTIGALTGLPLMAASVLIGDQTWAFIFYGAGCLVSSLHIGPIFGLIQSTLPVKLRGQGGSFMVLSSALIGAGLGPATVGFLSDLLTPAEGTEALRYAIAWSTLSFIPALVFVRLATRSLRRDLAAAHPG